MNKLHKFYVVLIAVHLVVPGFYAFGMGQVQSPAMPQPPERVYAIQVAASKVYIDPDFFKEQLKLNEDVRYVVKDEWYKYLIGYYKTESEANSRLAGLKFEGFVTSYIAKGSSGVSQAGSKPNPQPADSLIENKTKQTDSANLSSEKSTDQPIGDVEIRRLYNQKVREADSAFNVSKNLLLARKLYFEASLMGQEKNYPADQIVEIDKQLIQKQSHSVFSNFLLRDYVFTGLAALLIIGLVVFLAHRIRNRKRKRQASEDAEALEGPLEQELFKQLAGYGMNVPELDTQRMSLEKGLNSMDVTLRIESQLSLMRLDVDDPFAFLSKLEQDFTPLEQLLVYEMAQQNKIDLPDFSRWMKSPNESVVSFCGLMIGSEGIEDLPVFSDGGMQELALKILKNSIRYSQQVDEP